MPSSLQHSFPKYAFKSSRKSSRRGNYHIRILCSSPLSSTKGGHEEAEENSCRVEGQPYVVLVERYSNGTAKRYVLGNDLRVQTFLEQHAAAGNGSRESTPNQEKLSWLPDILKDFILPAGFPGSVSDDYLEYMLLQFPTNVTAWICHTLVTSSLLKAVGVGSFSGTTAAASAAAIRWVSKDGIGSVGRLFIGGRFGNIFDDDPKQWRMYADFIGSAGSIFDLSTQLYPAYFLPLASFGNLAKAVARGLKDPSFRVIQNHFAISGNLGEVAAKEEVWEVAAQLIGLAFGILVLDTPGLVTSYSMLTFTWLSMRLLHLWLRYQSLAVLKFNTINLKRARLLVKSHVLHSTVLEYTECNRKENILSWQRFMKPYITFDIPLVEMLGVERSSTKVKMLLKLYAQEEYVLFVNQDRVEIEFFVSFKVRATSLSVLRSLWQSYWLNEHWRGSDNVFDQLKQSLIELDQRFDNFLEQLEGAGWDVNQINLKVPRKLVIEEVVSTELVSDSY
ncbi:protein root UVB sensitive 5 isoform X2 [Macadamia integrifolia]|uniref:protein root UVB sensitive 5 isoform X2 n=1 Tax=Macadamia integrifolia TaxID=60698 RepID=UPI001C4FDC8E|nr:protein root UVB sensitive 5 isoform X2 [Macadamia integrifolia]